MTPFGGFKGQHAGFGIFVLALLLRILVISFRGHDALMLSNDAVAYNQIAVQLAEHGRFTNTADPPNDLTYPQPNRYPLLPLLLAAAYVVTGPRLLVGQCLLAIVGSFACVVIYWLGRRLFGEVVGLFGGVVASSYPFFLFLSLVPLTESLAILVFPVVALAMLKLDAEPNLVRAALVGVWLGFGALVKPSLLLFLPFWIVWLVFRHGITSGSKWAATALIVVALLLTPWAFRNRIAFGTFNPAGLVGWRNVYAGNGPYADYSLRLMESGQAVGWLYDPAWSSEFKLKATEMESESRARQLAFDFMFDHPSEVLALAVRKELIFWRAYPSWLDKWSWYPLAALVLVGLVLTKADAYRLAPLYLLILSTALLPVMFTSMPRFRAPIEPLLIVFAAAGVVRVWKLRHGVTADSVRI